MLLVRHARSHDFLGAEQALQWNDLTGKELQIRAHEKDETVHIVLEMKQEGRKTPDTLLDLATITVPGDVKAKYADDAMLEPTLQRTAKSAYGDQISMIQHLIDVATQGDRIVDMTTIQPVKIAFSVRIDRDENDKEIGQTVMLQINDADPLVYSPAGLFE